MKAVRIILWIVICIIFLLGLLYLFTGSLEWFPTPEQQEKAHITAIVMMVIPEDRGRFCEDRGRFCVLTKSLVFDIIYKGENNAKTSSQKK